MATGSTWNEQIVDDPSGPVLKRRPIADALELDITPMIDITFLLLIFFLVTSTPDLQVAVELPPARHGLGVSARTATIVTIAERGGRGPALVYLADGKIGAPLSDDPATQEREISETVEAALAEGRIDVLIKAERGVAHRDVARVARAAAIEGINLHWAVLEAE